MKNFVFLSLIALLGVSQISAKNDSQAILSPPPLVSEKQTEKTITGSLKPLQKIAKAAEENTQYVNIEQQILEILNKPEVLEKFQGQKGDKGEPGTSFSPTATPYNPQPGLATYSIQAPVGDPEDGVFFAANHFSGDDITILVFNTTDITATGNTALATATVASLGVGNLTSDSGAFLSQGGVWTNASSRELKENFSTITPASILEKISLVPIYQWNYKKESALIQHIGPLAEDFYESFNLSGEKGKTSISTIDPAGIALAGIQALYEKTQSLEKKLNSLSASIHGASLPLADTLTSTNNNDSESPASSFATSTNETTLNPNSDTSTSTDEVIHDNSEKNTQ